MSVVLRQQFSGDPGLFGFLGSALKSVTGAVSSLGIPGISGVAGIASRLLPGRGSKAPASRVIPGAGRTGGGGFQMPQGGAPFLGGGTNIVPGTSFASRVQAVVPGGRTGQMILTPADTGGIAPRGMKLNKTGYFRSNPNNPSEVMFVPPQSVWVKIRRRNPGNARANDRAISRISSAKKMAKHLGRISIREKC